MRISDALIALAAATVLSTAAHAAGVTDAVPGHPGVTYELLLRQAMPDLAKGADGHWSSTTVAHLRGLDGKIETDTAFGFDDVTMLVLKEAGRERLVLLTGDSQTGSGFSALLAVFDPVPSTPRLLDYLDVGGDRFVGLGSPRTLAIAAGTDALIVNNNHFNSNQNFSIDTLIYLDGGKLNIALSQFTLNSGFCGYEERQVPVYTVHDDRGARFRAITVAVTQTVKRTGETCDDGANIPKPSKRTYTDVYRWDAKTNAYATHTNAMKRLMGADP